MAKKSKTKDNKSVEFKGIFKKLTGSGLSITKHVLVGIFEFCDGMLDAMADPYAVFYGPSPKSNYNNSYKKEQIRRAIHDLKRQKLIKEYKDRQAAGKTLYKLTDEGIAIIKKQLALASLKNKVKAISWDRKWRVVVFDVPESERHLRDVLRYNLKELGFVMMQMSVWAYPFDVFDELEILIPDIRKHEWIKLMTAELESGGEKLEKKFKSEFRIKNRKK
jgi:flagellar biosynthesis regulator FlaF